MENRLSGLNILRIIRGEYHAAHQRKETDRER